MPKLDPDHVAWCTRLFATLSDTGQWGIPRTGLTFSKLEGKLVLVDYMPWSLGVGVSAKVWAERQREEFLTVQTYFKAAGIEVIMRDGLEWTRSHKS